MADVLVEWLENHSLIYELLTPKIYRIPSFGVFGIVQDKDLMFNNSFDLILDDEEYDLDVEFYCFQFGNNWYYTPKDQIQRVTLNPLKYLGKSNSTLDLPYPALAIRGGFDLLNGGRSYNDWCKKAKFLGINTLAITEKNTLGGVLKFQLACKKNNITPIIGLQIVVKCGEGICQVKCYVKDEIGWQNILSIYKEINVLNEGWIDRKRFLELTEGLFVVIDPKYTEFQQSLPFSLNIPELYWQLDSVEFDNNDRDQWYLLNVKNYIKSSQISPVLICDAFYLDKEDSKVRLILNNIADKRDFASSNQYLKSLDDIYIELTELFIDEESFIDIFEKARENVVKIAEQCKFNISVEGKHLPEYKMDSLQSQIHSSNVDLFYSLLESAIERKLSDVEDIDQYLDRLQEECRVIEKGGFIDYFLILWDIGEYCKYNDILRGIGRGSAGGSLVAYLLEITHIDPLKYGLLFERFLNEGRIGKSLPDIDTDFPSESRDQVKKYMEQKYGENQVCSVGTYTTLKIKAALKDLGRHFHISIPTLNYINKIIPDDATFTDLFHLATDKEIVKNFILSNVEAIEYLPLILNQPRAKSIHACATLILPDEKTVFEWMPVRMETKDSEKILVTEWEGPELEAAGFLKEDILGIEQLSKFTAILNLVKQNKGIDIDIYSIPLDDKIVYDYFCAGYNGDIFHFGSKGLTSYCRDLQPRNISDLIAGIALYRPGAMESNFHNEYVLRKKGERDVEFIPGTEEVTKDTYGLICYQEQIMQICQKVGGFSLVEADDIRKAMGKKIQSLLDSYKGKFIEGGVSNGYELEGVGELWGVLERFGAYGFNKSHAAAYAITGYICQWLKVHYPLEFWSVALGRANEEEIPRYISEIYDLQTDVGIDPPHINWSRIGFTSDFKRGRILWSIDRVKRCGEEAVKYILRERENNGEFFSLEEFLSRIPKSEVNKGVVENLILSGLFDEIEGIKLPTERKRLIDQFRNLRNVKVEEDKDILSINADKLKYEWWWTLQQRNLCGYGYFDYPKILRTSINIKDSLASTDEIKEELTERLKRLVIGVVQDVIVKTSKKGEFAQVLIDCNYENIWIIIWSEIWSNLKDSLIDSKGKILAVNGSLMYDSWRKQNVLQTEEFTEVEILS